MHQPKMRASHVKRTIEAATVAGPDGVARFRDVITPDLLHAVDNASTVGWLPAALDIAIYEIGHELFGADTNRARVQHALRLSLDGPMLHTMVQAAVRLFGLTPKGMFRYGPQAWKMIYRDCGALRYEATGEHEIVLHHDNVPRLFFEHPDYPRGIADSLSAVIQLCKMQGEVTLAALDEESASARLVASWSPSAAG